MPRGVYDRTESKMKHLREELASERVAREALQRELQNIKVLAREQLTQTIAPAPAAMTLGPVERFKVLRETLQQLISSRKDLYEAGDVGETLTQLDIEIVAELKTLSKLRFDNFGPWLPEGRPPVMAAS